MVHRRPTDDLLPEVLGKVYWEEGLGYRLDVELKDGATKVFDIEFINDSWYLLEETEEGFKTNTSRKIWENELETGYWPSAHPKNPKNLVLAIAPSFGDFLTQGTSTMTQNQPDPTPQINMGGAPVGTMNELGEENKTGGLKGKAPEIFTGDHTKSKVFLTGLKIYFTLNRNKPDVKNCYSRTLIALSLIQGPQVINWVETQFDIIEDELRLMCGKDEYDELLWKEFEKRFKQAYISSTVKESAFVKIKDLKMKGDRLDKYITEHTTLVSEVGWDQDSEMSCHTFREGLPLALAKKIIDFEGMPESLTGWEKHARKYHSRWAMSKALGYQGKRDPPGKNRSTHWNTREKKKEQDPDTMDVDFTQMHPDKKEQLMKTGSCFRCKKQGHLSRECSNRNKASIREATVQPPMQPMGKDKALPKEPTEPPSYESLLIGINACTMEDQQKLLEVFSNAGDSDNEDF